MIPMNQVRAALAENKGWMFYDHKMNRVDPKPGDWFLELEACAHRAAGSVLRAEAIVQYLGEQIENVFNGSGFDQVARCNVYDEDSEEERAPRGLVLILQNY